MKNYSPLVHSFLVVMSIFLYSCGQKVMLRKELKAYMSEEKNGLKQVVERKGIKVEAYLLRPEIIGVSNKPHPGKNDSLRYLMLSFSKEGREALPQVGGIDQYAQLLNSMSFDAAKYCHLIEGASDTLSVVNSSFSNTYGTGSSNNLLLVFKSGNNRSESQLVVDEMGFGLGKSTFKFKKRDIDNFYNIHLTD